MYEFEKYYLFLLLNIVKMVQALGIYILV